MNETEWSEYTDPTTVPVREAVEASPHRATFLKGLGLVEVQANRYEVASVSWWHSHYVYLGVRDTRGHYPCHMRMLVSFDLTNGTWASFESKSRYTFSRRGWGQFLRTLGVPNAPTYSTCENPLNPTSCYNVKEEA